MLDALWREVTGVPLDPAAVEVDFAETALPGPYRVAAAASTCVAATTLAAAELFRARGGSPGVVSVDSRHAAAAFGSEAQVRVDGTAAGPVWGPLAGDYPAADGWVKLHANYPRHAAAVLAALGVSADREAVAAAVALLPAGQVVEAVQAAGGAAAELRSPQAWRAHPQGAALAGTPVVAIDWLGAGPARVLLEAARPLAGIRVLDLTHVIAGPVCGRTLAAHGADVLHVGAAHLPVIWPLLVDTGFGKRSCHVDLRTAEGRSTLAALVAESDVLVQSYRPESLAAKGFGPSELAAIRPGIVVVELRAYGYTGPWRLRRGFDSLVQLASGIAYQDGADGPRPLPAQALDHGAGWLAAFGAITALRRQVSAGGSWHVRVSLAGVARWLDGLGRTAGGPASTGNYLTETPSAYGLVRHVRVPGELPGAMPYWSHGPHLPGSDPARW